MILGFGNASNIARWDSWIIDLLYLKMNTCHPNVGFFLGGAVEDETQDLCAEIAVCLKCSCMFLPLHDYTYVASWLT